MQTWQEQAMALQFGQRKKIIFSGSSPSAYISNSPEGIRIYDFRSGYSAFEPHGRLSASDVLKMRQADTDLATQRYPSTVPLTEAPRDARLWVLKTGLTPERATNVFGFGWAARVERVVIPILQDLKPTGHWTARAVDGRSPKYLMGKGTSGTSWHILDDTVVVVEDILSAIKVHLAGYGSMAVLGTSMSIQQAALLADRKVITWLDGDAAGKAGVQKVRKALSPFGVVPSNIETPRDPKLYNRDKIRELVNARLADTAHP